MESGGYARETEGNVRECLGQALAALTLGLEALICRAAACSERVAGSLKRLANPNGSSNRCGLSMKGQVMPKKYYTLVSKDVNNSADPWTIEFGDYSRGIVSGEMREYRYNNALQNEGEERREYKIISSGDSQAEIEAAVKELNRHD
jgi:hypothetical protein